MNTFTSEEWTLLMDAMSFTRQRFEAYPYDSAEFKRRRLREVDDLRDKLRTLRAETRRQEKHAANR